MKRKAINLPAIFIFLMAPFALLGQQLESFISADQITVQPDNILQANGNVLVKRGDVFIRAETMTVNKETKQIKFQEVSEFYDGNSIKLAGEDAVLSDDLSSGIINGAQVLIDNSIRIRAEEIKIKNSTVERVKAIDRITSCEECENDLPLWYFTASSATNDIQSKNIIYRDVALRLSGVPVGYIPYLRLPNPSVERARGFLIPELKITSNMGVGAKLPYFIPIGNSRDLLLTPYVSSKTKGIEYRYRQKFSDGNLIINGALSEDDISRKSLRSYYKANGSFELNYGVILKIKAGGTNDDTYLEDYSYGSEDDLTTDISLEKVVINNSRILRSNLNYVRDNKDDISVEEYYALSGLYKRNINQTLLPGNLSFEIEGNSALNVADGGQVSRPPSSIASGVQYSNYRNIGRIKILDQSFARLNSFVNSKNVNSLEQEFTLQYGVSSTLSLPFYKMKNTSVSQLSPKLMLSYSSQEGRTEGDYFSGANQLSIGNMYAIKKLESLSESELGFSVSGGLDYRINWNDGRALDFWLGVLWLEDTTIVQHQNGQLKPKTFNYMSGFNYRSNDTFGVSGDTMVANDGEILHANLSSKIDIKELNLVGRYEFNEAQTDERINEDLQNINLSASYTGFKNFGLSAIRRYDLSESAVANSTSSLNLNFSSGVWDYQFSQTFDRREPEKTQISAIYDNDCTRIRMILQNENQTGGSSDSIQSLSISVQLKPIASFAINSF